MFSRQPPPSRGYAARDYTPFSNGSQSSAPHLLNAGQCRALRTYSSAWNVTSPLASMSNTPEYRYGTHPRVIVQAGEFHQGVGQQQADLVGLGLVDIPYSPYQTWTQVSQRQNDFSQLPPPAQLHTPYSASQMATPQSFFDPDSLDGPHYWSPNHQSPRLYGRPAAFPYSHEANSHGNSANGPASLAFGTQHHDPHMNGAPIFSPHHYAQSASPTALRNQSHTLHKYGGLSQPTTTQPPRPEPVHRPSSLRKNMYSDVLPPSPSSGGHAERRTASGTSLQPGEELNRAEIERAERQRAEIERQRAEIVRAEAEFTENQFAEIETAETESAEIDPAEADPAELGLFQLERTRVHEALQREEQERPWLTGFLKCQELVDRGVEARVQECKMGGSRSCAATGNDLCFHCIQRQTNR
ncbi:hypothetical protein FKW77_007241 [Venturia effusa]|uniref:Uncharacterized protein n=1 Tax=Venturia effusa TaxID=50376 RepID=A0A517LE37_9PEZI|nr:hypothetical protein FKW77_007241 [Venturia effusa]